jgi:hypothetical protein
VNLQFNDLRIRLWTQKAIGYSGNLSPFLNLTTNNLVLNSSSLNMIAQESSGFGNLLIDFVWNSDETLPNVLNFELVIHSALGYMSVEGQKMLMRQKDGLWKQSEVKVFEENGNKSLLIMTRGMFIDTENMSLFRMQYNLSSDNKVLPSSLSFDLTIKNSAENIIFMAANLSLETGCKLGCSVCFIEQFNQCVKCHQGFEILNNTCSEIILPATVAQLIGTGIKLNRGQPLVSSIMGTVFLLTSRRFYRRSYWNIMSTEIMTKVIAGNVVTATIFSDF